MASAGVKTNGVLIVTGLDLETLILMALDLESVGFDGIALIGSDTDARFKIANPKPETQTFINPYVDRIKQCCPTQPTEPTKRKNGQLLRICHQKNKDGETKTNLALRARYQSTPTTNC